MTPKNIHSKTQRENPSTWTPYHAKNCTSCIATCCTMPVEVSGPDLVRLGLCRFDELSYGYQEIAKRLKKEKIIQKFVAKKQLFILSQKSMGECYFLNIKTRLCTVYDKRPEVCRQFPKKVGSRVGYCPYISK